MGATVSGDLVRYAPDQKATQAATDIYALLSVLAPLPLVEVRQDRADLTDVFLRLTGSETE